MEDVFNNLQDAEEHRDRADQLEQDAEETTEEVVRDLLDDGVGVGVSCSFHDGELSIRLQHDAIVEKLNERIPEDVELEAEESTQARVIIGEPTIPLTERERIKNLKQLISRLEDSYEDGAPVEEVINSAEAIGMDASKAEHEIEKLKHQGEVYEPRRDRLRAT